MGQEKEKGITCRGNRMNKEPRYKVPEHIEELPLPRRAVVKAYIGGGRQEIKWNWLGKFWMAG